MMKIKLSLADTKSYVSLDLNQSTGNAHLFKLIGELSSDKVTLKKKLDMGCVGNKLGKHLHNPRQQRNTFAHHSPSTTLSQIEG